MWFLNHEHYQKWLKQDSGPLLVTADPGCGKSVLAKYLIDYALPRSTTICYFFFKDQDQNTVRQALCALLHQLFSQKPSLIEDAMPKFHKDGQGLINSTESLWDVLRNAITDPQAGSVIIVLDALDECAESDFVDLVRNIQNQFRHNNLGYSMLKYLLTCRPYEHIVSKFYSLLDVFPNIRIPGEEESEIISREVNCVISHHVHQLSIEKGLSPEIKSHLERKLQEATHRTYLWVYLIFDLLQKEVFKKTPKGVESTIATLPTSIHEAYEQILDKSRDNPTVRNALSIILAANRPLSLSEMNIALNMDNTLQSLHDFDLESEEHFKTRLRSWCGLFISVHQGNIYFLHQTAREFLLADLATPVPSNLRWHQSITIQNAHAVLAKLCVRYLDLLNFESSPPTGAKGQDAHLVGGGAFLHYSARNWTSHFKEADIGDDDDILPFALRICNPNCRSLSEWWRLTIERWEHPGNLTDLMIASYYGHRAVVKLLLEKGADTDAKDSGGRTPLLWATRQGHEAIITLLLENGADINARDSEGQTPLMWAVGNGLETTVELLLEKGADVDTKDNRDWTPLSWAATHGQEAIVRLLLEKGAERDAALFDLCLMVRRLVD